MNARPFLSNSGKKGQWVIVSDELKGCTACL